MRFVPFMQAEFDVLSKSCEDHVVVYAADDNAYSVGRAMDHLAASDIDAAVMRVAADITRLRARNSGKSAKRSRRADT